MDRRLPLRSFVICRKIFGIVWLCYSHDSYRRDARLLLVLLFPSLVVKDTFGRHVLRKCQLLDLLLLVLFSLLLPYLRRRYVVFEKVELRWMLCVLCHVAVIRGIDRVVIRNPMHQVLKTNWVEVL